MMLVSLITAFCLRFILSFLPGISFDMGAWFGWADRLVSLPWGSFYSKEIWTNYTPGYFYILYLLRRFELLLKNLFLIELSGIGREVLFKFPANLADILTGILIYKFFSKKSRKTAILASAFYLFNIAIIFNSSVWGQADSVMTLLLFLSVYLFLNKKTVFSSLSYALAFLIKPQSLFLAPLFLLLLLKQKNKNDYLKFGFVFLLTVLVLSMPFFPNNPLLGIWKMIIQMGKDYPGTTINAFNFWYPFGNWQADQTLLMGISKYFWGLGLFFVFEFLIILKAFFKKNLLRDKTYIFLLASLLLLNFFLFPTRIHERYLFPFFVFFIVAAFSWQSLKLILIYIFLSLVHFANLYYVYSTYQGNVLKINFFYDLISNLSLFFSLSTIIIFWYLIYVFWREKAFSNKISSALVKKLPNYSFDFNRIKIRRFFFQNKLLVLLLIFSFLVRFWQLGHPSRFYFDEVYHAFTAMEMAKGNVAAWEWWNQPPKGMAYEWTHPPMAKLIMVAGIFLFGETAFGWRFFGALLGVSCVLLIYLLGKKLFNQKVALLATFLFAFDGLPLVMSRIGMNDIYFLFFTLLTFWLFLEKEYFFAGIALGFSLASKWTTIYLLPVLGLWLLFEFLKKEKGKRFNWLKRFLIPNSLFLILLPISIYLFSYLPFFLTNHSLNQWWELQHQMWWYHTGLAATHTYQSSALSWPVLARPVWFFVDYAQDSIANIYAMGNPLIWWGGLLVLPFVVWQAIKKKDKKLGFVIFAYLAFFLPWVFSPRIMFIYHYLPSVAFLCLFLGWVLNWGWRKKRLFPIVAAYLFLVLALFFFFYPHWTGLHVPKWLDNLYYWFPSWK